MKTNRLELLTILESVKDGIAGKQVMEQTQCFAFQNGEVATYNDEISMSVALPEELEELEGAVAAEELLKVLHKTKEDAVQVTAEGGELVLSAGKFSAGVPLEEDVQLPLDETEFPDDEEWEELPEGFTDALSMARLSAASDASRPALTCVLLEGECAVATDGMRLTRITMDGADFEEPVLVPVFAIPPILSIDPVEYAVSENWIHFAGSEDVFLACRIIAEQFPGIDKAVAIDDAVEVTFPEGLEEALDRAAVFAQGDFEQDRLVSVSLAGDELLIESHSDHGWSKETSKVEYDRGDMEFTIHPDLFQDLLKLDNNVMMNGDKLKFEGEDVEHVVTLV